MIGELPQNWTLLLEDQFILILKPIQFYPEVTDPASIAKGINNYS